MNNQIAIFQENCCSTWNTIEYVSNSTRCSSTKLLIGILAVPGLSWSGFKPTLSSTNSSIPPPPQPEKQKGFEPSIIVKKIVAAQTNHHFWRSLNSFVLQLFLSSNVLEMFGREEKLRNSLTDKSRDKAALNNSLHKRLNLSLSSSESFLQKNFERLTPQKITWLPKQLNQTD